MMALSAALLLVAGAARTEVTPVEKVVTMLKDLQAQVESDGGAEAATYDAYACFCKSKTEEKTGSVEELSTQTESLQADISSFSAKRGELDGEIDELNVDLMQYQSDSKSAHEMREDETKTYEMSLGDFTKAISALENAIATLKASKTEDMDLVSVKTEVQSAMFVAETLGIDTPHTKKVASLLKTQHHAKHKAKEIPDPFAEDSPPTSDYTFRSGDIIGTLESLLSTFKAKKITLDEEDAKAQSAFDLAAQAKKAQIKAAEESLATKQAEQSAQSEKLATAQSDLTATSALLNDDRLYLKDLTATCETKAKQWDQRSQTRADELAAITQAVSVLESTVAEKAAETRLNLAAKTVTVDRESDEDEEDDDEDDEESFLQTSASAADRDSRDYVAFLQKRPKHKHSLVHKQHKQHKHHGRRASRASPIQEAYAAQEAATPNKDKLITVAPKRVLPEHKVAAQAAKHASELVHKHKRKHQALVRKVQAVAKQATGTATKEQAVRSKLAAILTKAGKDLKSPTLAALATKVQEDPFAKVKEMIQGLITRLLEAEADEANHKGWCDTEIGKTLKDRDYRLKDLAGSHSEVESFNARKEKLTHSKAELAHEVGNLTADLANQTAARAEETAEHEQTVADAKAGQDAVQQAIDTLSHFYGEAAQGEVEKNAADQATAELLATKARVSRRQPSVADEAPDAGFDGAYKGSQGASTGILGLLDVIKGDFARSIEETEANEAQAKRDFVEFERETKVSIATKETALQTTTSELTEVTDKLSQEMSTLREQQGLLDTSVKTWTELLPQCVADPGMSAEERAARREQEISALKEAYAILNDEM